jgi:hypothetical protein
VDCAHVTILVQCSAQILHCVYGVHCAACRAEYITRVEWAVQCSAVPYSAVHCIAVKNVACLDTVNQEHCVAVMVCAGHV